MEKSARQDGKYANHYQRMVERHRQLNRYARKGQIVFAGVFPDGAVPHRRNGPAAAGAAGGV